MRCRMFSREMCAVLAGAMAAALGACSSSPDEEDRPTVPLLVAPSNGSYVGSAMQPESLKPSFRWQASTSTSVQPISYELQLSTDAEFGSDVIDEEVDELSYTPSAGLAIRATAPVGARYYWRVRACIRSLCSEYSRVFSIHVVRDPRDVNGDGYSDLVVSAYQEGRLTYGGAAYLYYGGPGATMDATADLEFRGSGGWFGSSVAFAGDVNADGFADFLVGDPTTDVNSITQAGSAYLYFGGVNANEVRIPDGTFDGMSPGESMGASVSSAGDVNGDGFPDVLIGATGADRDKGRAYLYAGGAGARFDTVIDRTLSGDSASLNFGILVASAGDLDGDGFDDLIFGDPARDRAMIHFGNATLGVGGKAPVTVTGRSGSAFGVSVAAVGDLNRDGFDDVAIGAGAEGVASVYFGNADSLFDITLDGTLLADGAPRFGDSVAGAGDVNGDGFADVLVGAPVGLSAFLYLGAEGKTFNPSYARRFTGATGSAFGIRVVAAGDLNGDGRPDLAVGAYQADRVHLYFGANGGFVEGGTLMGMPSSAFGYQISGLSPMP
jgi:FG-GAP-like repeat/FG-GAP repeat